MTNAIEVTLQPMGDADLPECVLTGTGEDIPLVIFPSGGVHGSVKLMLGNCTDASKYLMDLAERLADFAVEVSGIACDAPIPYALAEMSQP